MTDRPRYRRHGEGLEFDRASFFTDAVYAIAMTLLVVELRVPGGSDADLAAGLGEEAWAVVGFFFGFILLGRYWMAHHAFWASLASIDGRLAALNLVYLAFVAFIPWPVGLVSRHPHAFPAFAIFAGAMAIVSLLEVVLYVMAWRGGHLARTPDKDEFRRVARSASAPVAIMLASIPLALAVGPPWAMTFWLVTFPVTAWIDRHG